MSTTPSTVLPQKSTPTLPAKKTKGLGRGLEALLGPKVVEAVAQSRENETPSTLLLGQMQAGQYQPRTRMDEGALYELAESIKAQGIMQPILVRPLAASSVVPYEIIAGERRFRAAKLAGLERVPVLVKAVADNAAAAMALIENIQREDLNPLEEAQGIQRLVREFELTHEQAAQAVGRSRSAASNLLRLLNLAPPVQTLLMAGDLDMGHARALLALDGASQITAAHEISGKKLSVRQAEALVKKLGADFVLKGQTAKSGASDTEDKSSAEDREIQRLEQEISDALAAKVEVRIKKHSKIKLPRGGSQTVPSGEIAISFGSLEELNGLLDRLKG